MNKICWKITLRYKLQVPLRQLARTKDFIGTGHMAIPVYQGSKTSRDQGIVVLQGQGLELTVPLSARPAWALETKSPAKPPGFRPWRKRVQAACSISASS